mgnify:CR=1 FL=1
MMQFEKVNHYLNNNLISVEYYKFEEKKGWFLVTEKDVVTDENISTRDIHHEVNPPSRKNGGYGRFKIFLINDNGVNFVKPEVKDNA